jgi:hypothetical protein
VPTLHWAFLGNKIGAKHLGPRKEKGGSQIGQPHKKIPGPAEEKFYLDGSGESRLQNNQGMQKGVKVSK